MLNNDKKRIIFCFLFVKFVFIDNKKELTKAFLIGILVHVAETYKKTKRF